MIDLNGRLFNCIVIDGNGKLQYATDPDALVRHQDYEDIDLRRRISMATKNIQEPSDAQKEYGNFRKGHVTIQGLPITIEIPRDGYRRGKDVNGVEWSMKMRHHYGYIKRTESESDGDHIDVFIGPHPESEIVFVVDQNKPSGKFDEHKCMLGFTNEDDARKGYLANYEKGWTGFGGIKSLRMDDFKNWIEFGDTAHRIVDQKFNYSESLRNDPHMQQISELILQRSAEGMADAAESGNTSAFAKHQKKWADEVKRRIALKHLLIDYDGDNDFYASQWFDSLPENAQRAAFAHMDAGKGGGGGRSAKKVEISPNGKLAPSLPKPIQTPNQEAKAQPEAPKESPIQQMPESPKAAETVESPEASATQEQSPEQPQKKQFGLPDKKEKSKAEKRAKLKYDPKKDPTGNTLYKIVSRMGGISRQSMQDLGYDLPAMLEGPLSGLFPRQGGRSLEEVAKDLHSQGHVNIPGVEYHGTEDATGAHKTQTLPVGAEEYVLDQIQNKMKSLLYSTEDEYAKQYNAYVKEMEDAQRAGLERNEIEKAVRDGETTGITEAEKGDSWEGDTAMAQEAAGTEPWDFPEPSESSTAEPAQQPTEQPSEPAQTEPVSKPSMLDRIRSKQQSVKAEPVRQPQEEETPEQEKARRQKVEQPEPSQPKDEWEVNDDGSDAGWEKTFPSFAETPEQQQKLEKDHPEELKAWREARHKRKIMPSMDRRMQFRKEVLEPAYTSLKKTVKIGPDGKMAV